jgi:hypothetical protein
MFTAEPTWNRALQLYLTDNFMTREPITTHLCFVSAPDTKEMHVVTQARSIEGDIPRFCGPVVKEPYTCLELSRSHAHVL